LGHVSSGTDAISKPGFCCPVSLEVEPQLGQFEGRAEHIASGRVTRFGSQQQLFDFIVDLLKQYLVSHDEPDD
jgi:hypothetical protein